jgi:ABC-2 type transport system permease protein
MKMFSIIIKDLRTILSDKHAVAIIIVMPLILMTILSFALKSSFSNGDYFDEGVKIAVVKLYDKDVDSRMFDENLRNGIFSKNMGEEAINELGDSSKDVDPEKIFFEEFLGSDEVSKIMSYQVEDEKTAMDLLDKKEVSAVVTLPEKFVYDMKINLVTPFRNNVDIKVEVHPDKSIEGVVVKSVMEAYSSAMSSVIIGKNVIIEEAMANGVLELKNLDDVMENLTSVLEDMDVEIKDVVVEGRKGITSADYYAAAMMAMFILFSAGHGGRMLLEEKDNKTYGRMIMAGTSKFSILSGKFVVVFLLALIQIAIMINYSRFALKVQWGSIVNTVIISSAAAFAVAGLGAFIASATFRAGNFKLANTFESAIIQVMALLGGSFFPVDVMPEAIQNLSFLSLNGLALKSYLKVMSGYGLNDIIKNVAVLVVTGMIFLILSVAMLRGKEEHYVKHNKVKTVKA